MSGILLGTQDSRINKTRYKESRMGMETPKQINARKRYKKHSLEDVKGGSLVVSELSQWKNGNTAGGPFAERRVKAEKTGRGYSEHPVTQVRTQHLSQVALVGSRTGCMSLQCRHPIPPPTLHPLLR